MADPLDYTLVRMDNSIKDKAVLTYDAINDKITDSGLLASQGELQANAGTVHIGLQDMSSAGEQVLWTNSVSHVNYAPPWHVIDEVNPGGSYDRLYDPLQTVTRNAIRTDELLNPMFPSSLSINIVAFSLDLTFPVAQNNVMIIVVKKGDDPTNMNKHIWDEVLDVSAGKQKLVLKKPIAFYPGDYDIYIRPYGDINKETPIRVMGDAQTGLVGYDITYREFHEKPLATEDYVISAVTGGPADDVMLKATYDTNNNGKVDRADFSDASVKVVGIDGAPSSYYYGKDNTGTIGFHPLPSGVDETALKADIKAAKDLADINKVEIAKHETAINGHGTQLASHANQIATNTSNVKIATTNAKNAMDEGLQNRKNAANALVADINNTNKTITLKIMSQKGLIDAAVIDLSSWFSGGTQPKPGDDYTLYYGFTSKTTLPESEILRIGKLKTVSTIDSLDVNITRSSQTPNYIWIWLPDGAGTIKGFDFSGFVSSWGSVAVNVAGVDGKLYVSPNKTSATSVEFEVKV